MLRSLSIRARRSRMNMKEAMPIAVMTRTVISPIVSQARMSTRVTFTMLRP